MKRNLDLIYKFLRDENHWALVYKAPGQDTGKIIFATVAGSWDNGAIAFTNNGGHSFAKTLEDVVRDHINIKFLAYNNAPPGVPNVNTKSNSKGLIILSTAADSASWIVHTVPGFPTARTPYSWPAAENARGHLLICLTISESQINAIAASLLLVEPMVHYNDIPETETAGMPYFNMLAGGKIPTLPPFTSRRFIRTENATGPVAVHIYSKSRSSKYGDCRGSQRHIRLIKSPAAIDGHNTNLEADITNWAVSDPGNIFCHIDKPYFVMKLKIIFSEEHLIMHIKWFFLLLLSFPRFSLATSKCQDLNGAAPADWAILYKAPAQNTGKALIAGAVQNWQAYPQVTGLINHSFGKAVEHVVAVDANNKFIAYSNVPPDIPKVKTKSNSKGVLMMNPRVADEASWIVHTIPGFPKALRGYVFPPAEIQKGHLLICLTIKESQIEPIAKTLRIATPLIYHSDIPDTQMNSRPNLKKLVDGESRFVPPLTVSQEISTESAQGLKVTIYSKGEKSRYEMYKRILVKQLKSTIKVWTTRDNILKSDCRKVGRNIKLITSPISVNGDASTLENDDSQWLVSEAGNKFCAIDKPYHKSQAKEPAMAVCIDDVTIFTRFNEIAVNVENCL
ncbi:Plancitoxin-1 [Trichinella murrelli]|uniref:Plancitoxin-1 n=1 Tax=Trichinella murrelli TaxID=144512 RepID=A0A0V0T532_9BILA|nr:Plancitoxin-1 [Trichinella murrelli]